MKVFLIIQSALRAILVPESSQPYIYHSGEAEGMLRELRKTIGSLIAPEVQVQNAV